MMNWKQVAIALLLGMTVGTFLMVFIVLPMWM